MLVKARHNVPSYLRETVQFLGLNRSDATKDGEFSYQKNLSCRRYPYLAPRLPRNKEQLEIAPDALFYWGGHEIVAAGGVLYLDGKSVFTVTSGQKQFAVVNTKLVVWPDGVCVDLNSAETKTLGARSINKGAATFTKSSLSLAPESVYSSGSAKYGWSVGGQNIYAWTYSSVSWSQDTGWTVDGGAYTAINSDNCIGRYYIPVVSKNSQTNSYSANEPDVSFGSQTADKAKGNNVGFYCKFTKYHEDYEFATSGGRGVVYWDVYWAQQANGALDDLFSVGDVVTVSGSLYGYYDVDGAKITDIDKENNTILFADGTFRSGSAITQLSKDVTVADQKHSVRYSKNDAFVYYKTESSSGGVEYISAKKGQYALLDIEKNKLFVLDHEFVVVKQYTVKSSNKDSSLSATRLPDLTLLSPAYENIKVERKIPAMDFVCERENRLWGVSNSEKTIYASALGDPTNFYDYSGDSGAFAVAVGSEGDFTGICDYGNAVLCWKERTLHKVLGDYPSNYQTATYRFSGVRAGSHKSLVNVNETLFFLGVDGVYAYTGNKPSLISRALGTSVLKDGVGGTDGRAYYLCVRNGLEHELLNYDTHTGMWSRSDEIAVTDFCRVDDEVKFLSGDTVYTIGGNEESVEWEAVFVPMYETLEGGKQYNRLIFRVEVSGDSWLAADVRFDDGRWMQVGIVKGKNGPVHMPVPLRRCDKFQIRLRGKGDCAVLDMVREFGLRGDG